MGYALDYHENRAREVARQAYAKKLMETRSERATRDDPYAPAFSGLNSAMGAVAYRRAAARIVELDQGWHRLLFEVLGNAPSVPDFDMRAVALGLSPDEAKPFFNIFQLTQASR